MANPPESAPNALTTLTGAGELSRLGQWLRQWHPLGLRALGVLQRQLHPPLALPTYFAGPGFAGADPLPSGEVGAIAADRPRAIAQSQPVGELQSVGKEGNAGNSVNLVGALPPVMMGTGEIQRQGNGARVADPSAALAPPTPDLPIPAPTRIAPSWIFSITPLDASPLQSPREAAIPPEQQADVVDSRMIQPETGAESDVAPIPVRADGLVLPRSESRAPVFPDQPKAALASSPVSPGPTDPLPRIAQHIPSPSQSPWEEASSEKTPSGEASSGLESLPSFPLNTPRLWNAETVNPAPFAPLPRPLPLADAVIADFSALATDEIANVAIPQTPNPELAQPPQDLSALTESLAESPSRSESAIAPPPVSLPEEIAIPDVSDSGVDPAAELPPTLESLTKPEIAAPPPASERETATPEAAVSGIPQRSPEPSTAPPATSESSPSSAIADSCSLSAAPGDVMLASAPESLQKPILPTAEADPSPIGAVPSPTHGAEISADQPLNPVLISENPSARSEDFPPTSVATPTALPAAETSASTPAPAADQLLNPAPDAAVIPVEVTATQTALAAMAISSGALAPISDHPSSRSPVFELPPSDIPAPDLSSADFPVPEPLTSALPTSDLVNSVTTLQDIPAPPSVAPMVPTLAPASPQWPLTPVSTVVDLPEDSGIGPSSSALPSASTVDQSWNPNPTVSVLPPEVTPVLSRSEATVIPTGPTLPIAASPSNPVLASGATPVEPGTTAPPLAPAETDNVSPPTFPASGQATEIASLSPSEATPFSPAAQTSERLPTSVPSLPSSPQVTVSSRVAPGESPAIAAPFQSHPNLFPDSSGKPQPTLDFAPADEAAELQFTEKTDPLASRPEALPMEGQCNGDQDGFSSSDPQGGAQLIQDRDPAPSSLAAPNPLVLTSGPAAQPPAPALMLPSAQSITAAQLQPDLTQAERQADLAGLTDQVGRIGQIDQINLKQVDPLNPPILETEVQPTIAPEQPVAIAFRPPPSSLFSENQSPGLLLGTDEAQPSPDPVAPLASRVSPELQQYQDFQSSSSPAELARVPIAPPVSQTEPVAPEIATPNLDHPEIDNTEGRTVVTAEAAIPGSDPGEWGPPLLSEQQWLARFAPELPVAAVELEAAIAPAPVQPVSPDSPSPMPSAFADPVIVSDQSSSQTVEIVSRSPHLPGSQGSSAFSAADTTSAQPATIASDSPNATVSPGLPDSPGTLGMSDSLVLPEVSELATVSTQPGAIASLSPAVVQRSPVIPPPPPEQSSPPDTLQPDPLSIPDWGQDNPPLPPPLSTRIPQFPDPAEVYPSEANPQIPTISNTADGVAKGSPASEERVHGDSSDLERLQDSHRSAELIWLSQANLLRAVDPIPTTPKQTPPAADGQTTATGDVPPLPALLTPLGVLTSLPSISSPGSPSSPSCYLSHPASWDSLENLLEQSNSSSSSASSAPKQTTTPGLSPPSQEPPAAIASPTSWDALEGLIGSSAPAASHYPDLHPLRRPTVQGRQDPTRIQRIPLPDNSDPLGAMIREMAPTLADESPSEQTVEALVSQVYRLICQRLARDRGPFRP